MIEWKHWKTPKTRVRKLKGLGVPPNKAYQWGKLQKEILENS
jgi:RNA-directed DNA polymerase